MSARGGTVGPRRRGAQGMATAALLAAALAAAPAQAAPEVSGLGGVGAAAGEQGVLCRRAIRQAEMGSSVPAHMLVAIARVESGRRDPATGRSHPWPWTINAEGRGHYFETKAEAVAYARQLQARGVRSFDTGCMQVNQYHHPNAFASLEEAFDPLANARYAVRFLTQLFEKTGSWETASSWYHSANPEHGVPYRGRVVAAMAEEAKVSGTYAALPAPVPALGAARTTVAALPSMPSSLGAVRMLGGGSSGAILARPYAPVQAASAAGSSAAFGRGLDSYRMQPVALAGARLVASR